MSVKIATTTAERRVIDLETKKLKRIIEVGWGSIRFSLARMLLGAALYFPIREFIKPGVPDVDLFRSSRVKQRTHEDKIRQ